MSDALRMNDFSILADAVLGLGGDEQASEPMTVADMEAFELAAAALDLACESGADEPLPDHIRLALDASADRFSAEAAASRPEVISRIGHWATWGGWLTAAASVLIFSSLLVRPPATDTTSVPMAVLTTDRQQDVRSGEWADWALAGNGPEIAGVTGSVAWSESAQVGYMRFSDLPEPAGEGSVYQVWVIDSRGLADAEGRSERISGGTFTAASAARDPETGELIVPINPAIDVQGAAAFAVTIEDAGGTWVSDLSRRLVIAELAG